MGFQSPHGDFGFLKRQVLLAGDAPHLLVSIPSRGFWFFEVRVYVGVFELLDGRVSIPSRGFWFFEGTDPCDCGAHRK